MPMVASTKPIAGAIQCVSGRDVKPKMKRPIGSSVLVRQVKYRRDSGADAGKWRRRKAQARSARDEGDLWLKCSELSLLAASRGVSAHLGW